MRYRADLPLMVLAYKDNHHAAVPIPAGKLIHVIGFADDDRFLVVNVDGEEFHVFETDVRERGMPLPGKRLQSETQEIAANC